jgi:chemotaxis protein methyltransferase CheR
MQGPLDVVMCRNVMIYLDPPTRKRLVLDVERILRPGGLLLVGHSESVMGLGAHLVIDQPSVYRMPAAP